MNRRNFLKNIIVAGASFSILPGAGRIWKAQRADLIPVRITNYDLPGGVFVTRAHVMHITAEEFQGMWTAILDIEKTV